ncbi:hypothetical protein GEMRC1_002124 [Eukaryota sp. GEM-RC1]
MLLPRSLLVLIHHHVIRNRLNPSCTVNGDEDSRQSLHCLMEQLPSVFQSFGFVSKRFFESCFSAVRLVFERTTLFTHYEHLPQLFTLSALFQAELRSLSLEAHQTYDDHQIHSYSCRVSELAFGSDFNYEQLNLISSYPNLLRLTTLVRHSEDLQHLCHCLTFNSTVEELNLSFRYYSSGSQIIELSKLFSGNSTLNIVKISTPKSSLDSVKVQPLLTSLFNNTFVQSLDLSELCFDCSLGHDVFSELKNNSSLKELYLGFHSLNNSAVKELVETLEFNNTLKKLHLQGCSYSLSPVFKYLATNTSLLELDIVKSDRQRLNHQEVKDLVDMIEGNSHLLVLTVDGKLLSSYRVKTILKALENNLVLKKVSFPSLDMNVSLLMTVFESLSLVTSTIDVWPHAVNFNNGIFCLSSCSGVQINVQDVSVLQSLLSRCSIKNFTIKGCRFTDQAFADLCDLIGLSDSLTFVDFSDCQLSDNSVLAILRAIHSNTYLKQINLNNSGCTLLSLFSVFELFSVNTLLPNIEISPHSIDLSRGCIHYDKMIEHVDLVSLLKALKSNIPIKSLKFSGLIPLDLKGLSTIFEILTINNSVLDLDITPHVANVEKGILIFSSHRYFHETSNDELSTLKSIVSRFKVKELGVTDCRFTKSGINILCDIIRTTSLTSVDLSSCALSDFDFSLLIRAIQSNSSLKRVDLSNNALGIQKSFEISEINVYIHTVDVSTGLISYQTSVKNDDIIALLQALRSNIPIKRLYHFGSQHLTFIGVVALYEVLSINPTITTDEENSLYYHCVDVINGIFSYTAGKPLKVKAKEVESLHALLRGYSIRELTLKRFRFSVEAINVLCDFFRVNNSLTLVDLSQCLLSDSDVLKLIRALEQNTRSILSSINLQSNRITSDGARSFTNEMIRNSMSFEVDFRSNSIDSKTKQFLKTLPNCRVLC